MATADMTTFNYDTGQFGVRFTSIPTEASAFVIIPMTDHSQSSCYINYVQLACSCGANVRLVDGSNGKSFVGPLACGSGSSVSQGWDFKGDPIILAGDSTEGIDVSSSGAGVVSGFVKYHWGPKR